MVVVVVVLVMVVVVVINKDTLKVDREESSCWEQVEMSGDDYACGVVLFMLSNGVLSRI